MKRNSRILLATLGLVSVAALGCRSDVTPVSTLLEDPSRYDHQTVRVAGTVEHAAGLLGYGLYRVNDGTGTLTVLTSANGAPRTGAKVGVEGEFRAAFTLGTESLAVVMEKERFTPKR